MFYSQLCFGQRGQPQRTGELARKRERRKGRRERGERGERERKNRFLPLLVARLQFLTVTVIAFLYLEDQTPTAAALTMCQVPFVIPYCIAPLGGQVVEVSRIYWCQNVSSSLVGDFSPTLTSLHLCK